MLVSQLGERNHPINALVDTGASVTLISQELVFQSPYLEGLAPIPLRKGHTGAHLADGSFLPYAYYLAVKLFISGQPMYHVFIVCNQLSSPIILGKDFLKAHKQEKQFH